MNRRDDENCAVLARVRVVDAVPGCASALQYREDHVQLAADDDLEFTASITLKVHDDGAFDPSGMQVNGPRATMPRRVQRYGGASVVPWSICADVCEHALHSDPATVSAPVHF